GAVAAVPRKAAARQGPADDQAPEEGRAGVGERGTTRRIMSEPRTERGFASGGSGHRGVTSKLLLGSEVSVYSARIASLRARLGKPLPVYQYGQRRTNAPPL